MFLRKNFQEILKFQEEWHVCELRNLMYPSSRPCLWGGRGVGRAGSSLGSECSLREHEELGATVHEQGVNPLTARLLPASVQKKKGDGSSRLHNTAFIKQLFTVHDDELQHKNCSRAAVRNLIYFTSNHIRPKTQKI